MSETENVHKRVMRAMADQSGASDVEFMAAMLGALSLRVDLATWTEAATNARDCFRDRQH